LEVNLLIQEILEKGILIQATFSNPHKKGAEGPSRVGIRPILAKGERLYQLSQQVGEKMLHRNVESDECYKLILDPFLRQFKQALFQTTQGDYQLLSSKKGALTLLAKPPTKQELSLAHNRQKQYLLSEGPFLIELGLMNSSGRILPQKQDKFRQINRFLEMVEDTLHLFKEGQSIEVIDFGCGKAYLTFALYHLLTEIKGFSVQMRGIDLKADVIEACQRLADKLGYRDLQFQLGNIADYSPSGHVDMVVALHACDTATDAALAKAVRWGAKVILAAPCCQHELSQQLSSKPLEALLRYGILKERFAALATDAARAALLEMQGYATQILEFIDSIHTPKNLLIRAVRGNTAAKREEAKKRYLAMKECLSIAPILEQMLR
jgi:SAM-dependent methyltransferase